ncbi:MAG: hypothetical protein AAGA84_10140 [Pseudomonadota bacterium]
MDNFDLDDAVEMIDTDGEFDYESDMADSEYEYDAIDAIADDEDLEMDAIGDDFFADSQGFDFDIDEDYDGEIDDVLMDAVNVDQFGEEAEHGDLVGGMALGALIRRRRNKKKRKELARQKRLQRLMKRPSRNYKTALANRRSISALRAIAMKNRAGVKANRTTTARLNKVAASNSRRINKASIAASRANTVNKAQSRRLRRLRKIQRTDGALDLSRSLVLTRTDAGIGLSVSVTDALKGAVKHGWLGSTRGVLGNPAVIAAAGFLGDNLTKFFPQIGSPVATAPSTPPAAIATPGAIASPAINHIL